MSYDISDFRSSREQEKRQRAAEFTADRLRFARQAEIASELLTHDTHWDAFLQILQGKIEDIGAERAALLERLGSNSVGLEDAERLRIEAIRMGAIVNTLELVLAVPSALKEDGQKARSALDSLGVDGTPPLS